MEAYNSQIEIEPNVSSMIDVLHREYASRKFARDCKKGKKILSKWPQSFMAVVGAMHRYTDNADVYDALKCFEPRLYSFKETIEVLQGNEIIYGYISRLIVILHNKITDNPEFAFQPHFCIESASEEKILNVVSDDVLNLRKICLEYGYFPYDLNSRTNPLTLIKAFNKKRLASQNPFIRFYPYSNILSAHFVSNCGNYYFEKEHSDKFYIYYDSSRFLKFIDDFEVIRNNLKKRGKKNFIKVMEFGEDCNIQICVNSCKSIKGVSTDEIIKTIGQAICCALMYFEFPLIPVVDDKFPQLIKKIVDVDVDKATRMYSISKNIHNAYREVQKLKYKKISFIKRCIGLHIWDNVELKGKSISDEIESLMGYLEGANFEKNCAVFSGLKDEKTREIAQMIFEDYATKSSKRGKCIVPDFRDFRREFDITCECIETLSVCAHYT